MPLQTGGNSEVGPDAAECGERVVVNVAVFGEGGHQHQMPVEDPLVAESGSDLRAIGERVAGSDRQAGAIDLQKEAITVVRAILDAEEALRHAALRVGHTV